MSAPEQYTRAIYTRFTPSQYEVLVALSQQRGNSLSDTVREAVIAYFSLPTPGSNPSMSVDNVQLASDLIASKSP